MIPNELMPLKGTGSHWAISSEDVKIRRKKCTEWHQKKRFWYAKATTTCRIHIHSSHLATWINRKTMIKAKAFILWTDKIVFSGKFVCLCTSCKTKLETLNNQACRLYHKLFMVFWDRQSYHISNSCMLQALCYLYAIAIFFITPVSPSKHRKAPPFWKYCCSFGDVFSRQSVNDKPRKGGKKRNRLRQCQALPKSNHFFMRCSCSLTCWSREPNNFYALQAKWVMWNQKKAALKEMRRLKH